MKRKILQNNKAGKQGAEGKNENIYFHAFGCKVNQYEGQALRERFLKDGYRFTNNIAEAGALLIQSCTVTTEADRQCRQMIRKALKTNPALRIFISGCYAARAPLELKDVSSSIEVLGQDSIRSAESSGITGFENHSRAFVKIQDGCDAFCSYCIVPYVRSVMTSRPEKEILAEVSRLVRNGYPEIVLTGVRLGKYAGGLENLLRKILDIEGGFRVRLSSLELNEVSENLIELMKDNPVKLCRHLHLPMQSGADSVLKKMNRTYTAQGFAQKIGMVQRVLPDAGISTDIIVGFPGETDRDFSQTYELTEKLGFSRLHVFRYSKREGTAASSMKDNVPQEKIKERSKVLRDLDKKLQTTFFNKFVGTERFAVLEAGKNTLLTDNYIRLNTDIKTGSINNKILKIKITCDNGRPWAESV